MLVYYACLYLLTKVPTLNVYVIISVYIVRSRWTPPPGGRRHQKSFRVTLDTSGARPRPVEVHVRDTSSSRGYLSVEEDISEDKIDLTHGQFKEHIDLQKIAEIMFNNEKYNVLKPTIHIIKDHFVEFIQKRDNREPSKRIFLDRNGLRHSWKGLEIPRLRSLRKADVYQKAIDDKNGSGISSLKINASATVNNNTSIKGMNTNTKRKQPRRATKKSADVVSTPDPMKSILRNDATVVKTTFFCPFFGVVRMFTSVDKFEETGNVTRR